MIIRADAQKIPLPDELVDAVVTDPPYDLKFMGKKWDGTGVAFQPNTWVEVMRVMKPGAHLIAFGGTRTHHRMVCAIEDAGFEIRDSFHWMYSSGFPKSLDVSKAIDKEAGAEREVVGVDSKSGKTAIWSKDGNIGGYDITAPATPEAEQWQGWGTSLKPAHEPAVLARKPISEKTVAQNVLRWGTGALAIDSCRIEGVVDSREVGPSESRGKALSGSVDGSLRKGFYYDGSNGRWPANVLLTHHPECSDSCHEDCPVRMLDEQSGVSSDKASGYDLRESVNDNRIYFKENIRRCVHYGDSGGASRFFKSFYYCAKASASERGQYNDHPTVKPEKLMSYLCQLVTPPGGLVLDPFCGSGTTVRAAISKNFRAVGMDLAYQKISTKRTRNIQRSLLA